MSRHSHEKTLLSSAQVRAIVDSTDATPVNVQVTGHGFSTGDEVMINGHLVNVAANGRHIITKVDANNFTLDGVAGSGAGAGGATGAASPASKAMLVQDAKDIVLHIDTDGGGDAAMTVKAVGSSQEARPDFGAAQSTTNRYEFLELIKLDGSGSVLGTVGFVVAGADDHIQYEVNVNGQRWFEVLPTAGSAGEVTVLARSFSQV